MRSGLIKKKEEGKNTIKGKKRIVKKREEENDQ